MTLSAGFPAGTTVLLGDAARALRRTERGMVERLEVEGYEEVILPMLDYLEPYAPLLGPSIRRELYQLLDRNGDLMAVRADFTPLLARFLAPRLARLDLPLRLFYRGDVVRAREGRAAHLRELYQLGGELIGEAGEAAEGEILRLCTRLAAATLPEVHVVLGGAGLLDQVLLEVGAERGMELARAARRRERWVGGELEVLGEVVREGVPRTPAVLGPAGAAGLERLTALGRSLEHELSGVSARVDLAEFATQVVDAELAAADGRRAYYDGLVFRLYGRQGREIGSGGRYDRLFRRLGAPVPAVGFTLGLERLLSRGEGESR